MMEDRTLVVLAAGLGTRFAGGVKQLQSVGPSGEVLMDYSIYDALEAGFNRVVFIIRHEIQELFDATIGARCRKVCRERGVEVLCAYQDRESLPGGYTCPKDRTKPWGTGHALLSCKGMLDSPFAVINADDYYGKDAYRKAIAFLNKQEEWNQGAYGLVGFCLRNTLSDHGGVNRGICSTDEHLWLSSIQETKDIVKTPQGAMYMENGEKRYLDGVTPVSMNMWCFSPDVLDQLEALFVEFLEHNREDPGAEFLIPTAVGQMLERGTARVKVLPTGSQWFGMTYVEDMPVVREALAAMTDQGVYSSPLYL